MELCTSCKELAVEFDTSCAQKVCTACGEVVAGTEDFTTDPGPDQQDGTGYAASSQRYDGRKRPFLMSNENVVAGGKRMALERMRHLCLSFKVPSAVQKKCKEMLGSILKCSPYRTMANDNKVAVAVCIVYAMLRQDEWPVTIRTLCDAVNVRKNAFSNIYSDVLEYFDISITTPSVEELLPSYLKDSKLKGDAAVKETTMEVLELARETWLSYGKRPDALVSAAVYVAWMAADVSRVKTSYKNFCAQTNVNHVDIAKLRVTELVKALTKLCRELPWNKSKETVTKREVLFSVRKIYQHRKLLLANLKEEDSAAPYPFVEGKKKKTEGNAPETLPFTDYVSNNPELTDADIPASQMHEFIRSPAEVEQIKNITFD